MARARLDDQRHRPAKRPACCVCVRVCACVCLCLFVCVCVALILLDQERHRVARARLDDQRPRPARRRAFVLCFLFALSWFETGTEWHALFFVLSFFSLCLRPAPSGTRTSR